ncbi:hypothetical protein [Streptomyces cinereospinus]|uniref:Uncharacterized protein n=1 Tax=Streptomyces cinereospinus TaxID=285561 RepID=A0ABV5N4S9_9ACTN
MAPSNTADVPGAWSGGTVREYIEGCSGGSSPATTRPAGPDGSLEG